MTFERVIADVTHIFRDTLDDPSLELTSTTTAADVKDWDSLSHIQLVVAVEKHFKIKFTSAELLKFKNVGEMCDSIIAKLQ